MSEHNNKQERPDYTLTGEEWYLREGSHHLEIILALGQVSMQISMLTDAIFALTQEVSGVKKHLASNGISIADSALHTAANIRDLADSTIDDDGISIAQNVRDLSDSIDHVVDADNDDRLKVHVNGSIQQYY